MKDLVGYVGHDAQAAAIAKHDLYVMRADCAGIFGRPNNLAAFIALGQFDCDKIRLPDQRPAIVPQLAAPLVNMLPGDVMAAGDIGDERAVRRGFRDDPQLLRVGQSAAAFNSGQNLLPHKSPR
ncbi:MAG: hypothetical protein WBO09_00810 [Methylocystis silviterrae]